MRPTFAFMLALVVLPLTTYATKPRIDYASQMACEDGMRKNISFSTNFNGQEKSLNDARNAIESNKNALQATAKKAGVAIDPVSYNYNISMNNNYNSGTTIESYNYSGNLNYQIQNEEQAKKLGDLLSEQKRQFSMNVSANKCNN